ncbi:hypothetical protein BDR07DRAFT_1431000, partial [Suillus spraguei]
FHLSELVSTDFSLHCECTRLTVSCTQLSCPPSPRIGCIKQGTVVLNPAKGSRQGACRCPYCMYF